MARHGSDRCEPGRLRWHAATDIPEGNQSLSRLVSERKPTTAPQPMLTVGLTSTLEAGFSTVDLTCLPPANTYVGPTAMDGYPVCLAAIPETTIAVSGLATGTLTGEVIFDTGTPSMTVSVPAGISFPAAIPDGADVLITTPSGFTYPYTSAPGITNVVVEGNSTVASIIGIAYFTTNSLFIDFAMSIEGWK